MIQLELTPEERDEFRYVIQNILSDLRMEIADTDKQDYRERLKLRKALLKKVLGALDVAALPGTEETRPWP